MRAGIQLPHGVYRPGVIDLATRDRQMPVRYAHRHLPMNILPVA